MLLYLAPNSLYSTPPPPHPPPPLHHPPPDLLQTRADCFGYFCLKTLHADSKFKHRCCTSQRVRKRAVGPVPVVLTYYLLCLRLCTKCDSVMKRDSNTATSHGCLLSQSERIKDLDASHFFWCPNARLENTFKDRKSPFIRPGEGQFHSHSGEHAHTQWRLLSPGWRPKGDQLSASEPRLSGTTRADQSSKRPSCQSLLYLEIKMSFSYFHSFCLFILCVFFFPFLFVFCIHFLTHTGAVVGEDPCQ